MAATFEMFMNCNKKFIGIYKKKRERNMTAKQGIVKGS